MACAEELGRPEVAAELEVLAKKVASNGFQALRSRFLKPELIRKSRR